MAMKIGKPRYRFVITLSMRCVIWYVSLFWPVAYEASLRAP